MSFKEFVDDVGKKLNFVVGETTSKTKEIAGVTKLNTAIAARQHEVDDAFAEIGRALFEREAANPDSPVAALCAKIIANQKCIGDMKQQILDLKNATIENRKARSEALFGQKDEAADEAETEAVEAEAQTEVETEVTEPAEEAAPEEPEEAAEAEAAAVEDQAEQTAGDQTDAQ